MNQIDSSSIDRDVRIVLIGFVILLITGVSIGLVYVYTNTGFATQQTVFHYAGSGDVESDIPEFYPKSFESLLLTTHIHLIAFSIIFIFVSGLFYFNRIIGGALKTFLMVEPFIATFTTFGSIWGIRYIHQNFSYVTFVSGILLYTSFYFMTFVILLDLFNPIRNKK